MRCPRGAIAMECDCPLCKIHESASKTSHGDFVLTYVDRDGVQRSRTLTDTYQSTAAMVAHGIGRRHGCIVDVTVS